MKKSREGGALKCYNGQRDSTVGEESRKLRDRVEVKGIGQTLQGGEDTGSLEGIRRMGWKEDGAENNMLEVIRVEGGRTNGNVSRYTKVIMEEHDQNHKSGEGLVGGEMFPMCN